MKIKKKVYKEFELAKVIVKAGVRYWMDCRYSEDNGKTWVEAKDDDEETDEEFKKHIPFIKTDNVGYDDSDYWCITIDINTGKVENWKKNFCIDTHFKICDDGLYQILDVNGEVVWDSQKDGDYYVPDFLAIGDEGYGDYMYLTIDGEGNIQDWKECAIPDIERLFVEEDE